MEIVSGNSNIIKPVARQGTPFVLRYLMPEAADAYLSRFADQTLCVVGFGAKRPAAKPDCPLLWVDMPVLGSGAVYEVWTSNKPVEPYQDGSIAGAGNEGIFFGCMSVRLDTKDELGEAVQRAYSCIFDFLQRSTCPNLLRVWNYIPEINVVENGMERYHSFSVGRHEAFVRHDRKVEDSPAACALGSCGESLIIYFLASRFAGMQIENPFQTSAYNYPNQYGPRSPTFSRATLACFDSVQTLFISGTASILGYETVHQGSVSLQARETLANLRAVIGQACREGFEFAGFENGLALKVYVRHAEDMDIVRNIIQDEWGVLQELVFLQADICRTDLLLEIEAVCWSWAG